jgi:hypothetical protein
MLAIAMAIAVSGCGGSDSSGSTGTTPTAPTPSPPPPPTYSYTKYAALTGNQSFKTACASIQTSSVPPIANPATPFGQGLALDYVSANDSYTISGNGLSPAPFLPGDLDPAAPSTVKAYRRPLPSGVVERLTIGQPVAGGATLEYARGLVFATQPSGGPAVQYSCVFGVPTIVGDAPTGSNIPFAKVAFNGTAYVVQAGAQRVYSLSGSTATFAVNLTSGIVTITLDLSGILQTPAGPSGGAVALGSYTGSGTIDTTAGSYTGTYNGSGGYSVSGTFGGWFFGPQGAESLSASTLVGITPAGENIVVAGNVIGIRQ